jgi:hypothetical protein
VRLPARYLDATAGPLRRQEAPAEQLAPRVRLAPADDSRAAPRAVIPGASARRPPRAITPANAPARPMVVARASAVAAGERVIEAAIDEVLATRR